MGRTNFEIDHASHTTHKLMATPQVFVGHHRVFEDMLNYVIKPGIVTPFVLFGSVGAGKTAVALYAMLVAIAAVLALCGNTSFWPKRLFCNCALTGTNIRPMGFLAGNPPPVRPT